MAASAACKARTAYNRHCKEVAKRRLAGAALDRTLARITQRQVVNDSRKRPRDDAGFVYEPKWFKAAARALNRCAPAAFPTHEKQLCAPGCWLPGGWLHGSQPGQDHVEPACDLLSLPRQG